MIKITSVVFILCLGALLINSEAKAQSQKDESNMEQIANDTTELQLSVTGMSCQAGCANGIDNMLKQQKGVVKSKTTYDTGTSMIWYNKELISQKEIENLIRDRGFKVKVKTGDQKEDL